jgi:CheY-like chemotaxis protein
VAAPGALPHVLAGVRVLVVDDDRVALAIFRAAFESAGASVQAVGSGKDALLAMQAGAADFLLCDVYMPEMDGFEVIRRVRELPAPAGQVPAVAITAHPSFENRRDALRAGFQDLLGKPTEPRQLVEMVARICGRT